MAYDPMRLRSRAIDCLNIAKGTRSEVDAEMLEEFADELEEEARKIEAEAKPKLGWTPQGGLQP